MNNESEQQISAVSASNAPAERGLRRAWVLVQSTFHWLLSAAYFFPMCAFLVLLGIFIDPRKNDGAQRMLCRVTMKLAGAKLEFFRGLEFESHFRIPVYGWMMKRFGNVPVPDNNRPSDLKRMWRLTRAALDSGVSLAVFPEGQRTRDGRLGPFKDGVFRMAMKFGTPIVPVSMVGAFEFNKKTSWLLRPGTITVYLHDVIETKGLRKEDFPALRDRVQAIISSPIDEAPDVQKAGDISG